MAPAVIGGKKTGGDLGPHPPGDGHVYGGAGKTVQAAHQQRPQQRPAADGDAQRQAWRGKGGGVEQHRAGHLLRVSAGPAHADGAAPVVHDQPDRAGIERGEQVIEVVQVVAQPVGVRLRLVGKPAAEMVGDNAAVAVAQGRHQVAVQV